MNKIIELASLVEKPRLCVMGLMSGTSMDGLDICITDIAITDAGLDYTVIDFQTVDYPPELTARINQALKGNTDQICELNYELGRWYAAAIGENIATDVLGRVDLIGSHGQTLHHVSGRSTLQIGDPQFISRLTGKPVVFDFRAADIIAGGTGAPLIPRLDEMLFSTTGHGRIVLNIGGVANVSLVPPAGMGAVTGFDTGPGMALLDEVYRVTGGAGFDHNGELAAKGESQPHLVREWMNDDYIKSQPPKSTGRDRYGLDWLKEHPELENLSLNDQLATLAQFTAESIHANCRLFLQAVKVDYLIVGGGGVHHQVIMAQLQKNFNDIEVVSSARFGLEPDAKEAMGMAVFAALYLKGISGNVPEVTGAEKAVVLGKLAM